MVLSSPYSQGLIPCEPDFFGIFPGLLPPLYSVHLLWGEIIPEYPGNRIIARYMDWQQKDPDPAADVLSSGTGYLSCAGLCAVDNF